MPSFPPSLAYAVGAALMCCGAASRAGAGRLKPLPELRVDLASRSAVIASPDRPQYRDVAQRLAENLAEATKHKPRIAVGSMKPGDLGGGPVIVLGNLMDSELVRRLYFQAYDFTDYAWPGAGGHVVRTIRDPFGTGAHVVMVGGSDAAGVADAAKRLAQVARERGPEFGYVNEVKLGRWASEVKRFTQDVLTGDDAFWRRSGGSGSWDYQSKIAKAALGYLRTGEESYLPVFRRELRYFFDHDVRHPNPEAPQMVHGFMNTLLIPWDLAGDHPCFTGEERLQFDEDFLYVFRSSEGPRRIEGAAKRRVVRDNHGTRTGLDAFFGGRYFLRRYGLQEAQDWLDIADRYFAAQIESSKPVEDSWGHQWAASLFNTLVYAMASGKHEYFGSPAFRQAADRALIAHARGAPPLGYMSACAAAAQDAGYLSGWRSAESVGQHAAEMAGAGDEHLRGFCTGEPIKQRDDLLGVAVAPVDRLWFDTIDAAGFNPGGLFAVTAPREECFDKISIREGWGEDDFCLIIDGISGGHHSYQNGNCIVSLHECGAAWFVNQHSSDTSMTVRTQNGVFVALSGAGPGRLHRYARKLYHGQSGHYLAAAAALERVGDADWQRHILRKRGNWTLVIDRVTVRTPGELLAERHWRPSGEVAPAKDGLVSVQRVGQQRRRLHLQSAGLRTEGMSGASDRKELVRADAAPDRPFEFATLLHVSQDAREPTFQLTQTKAGWRVESSTGAEFAIVTGSAGKGIAVVSADGVAVIGEAPVLPPSHRDALASSRLPPHETLRLTPAGPATVLPWRALSLGAAEVAAVARHADGRVAAGDRSGLVRVFGAEGRVLLEAKFESPILSLHFSSDDLLVGEDRGALTRLRSNGSQAWRIVTPYVPMPWPNWSEERSRIREVASADIDDDGADEILASNSDRRVYAFTADGKELWKTPVEWGVFTAMTPGQHKGKFALFGGASRPSIHGYCILFGADGRLAARLSRPDIVSWSVPSQFSDMRLADLDGDGEREVITALDTNCRQLIVYKQDGSVLWDADVAGAAQAVAVSAAGAGSPPTVLCAAAAGHVSAYDGAAGRRKWTCYVGEPTCFIAPCAGGRVLAVAPSGKAFVIDANGNFVGCNDLGAAATAVLRPGDHRAENAIVVGLADGRILTLPRSN